MQNDADVYHSVLEKLPGSDVITWEADRGTINPPEKKPQTISLLLF